MMHWLKGGVRLVCVVVLGMMAGSVGLGAETPSSADIEQNLTDDRKGSLEALLALYDGRANAMMPILVPDESGSIRQVVDFGRVTIDEQNGGFPDDFLNVLSFKGVYDDDYDVVTYPILIILDERTHDYLLTAHDGTELRRVERPKDYDPLWYSVAHFKQLGLQPTRQEFKDHARMYNPARIVGLMELVTVEGAQAIAADSELLSATLEMPPPPMLMSGGPYVGSLSVEGMELNTPSSGDITLTIGYPSGMEGVPLDIIGCDDLMTWNWSVLASTNAPSSTNRFEYVISPISTNRNFVTVYRTDLPAGDTDGDGVPNGEEQFIDGTDPDDPPNISGTVTYTDWGVMYPEASVVIKAIGHTTPDYEITLSTPGPYQFPKLAADNYNVHVYIDQDGTGWPGWKEPRAEVNNFSVTGQVMNINLDIVDIDSDNDGLPDWWEYQFFFDTNSAVWTLDGDEDALNNRAEFHNLTDPTDADTDNDGMGDGTEVARGFNPVLPPSGYSQYMGLPFTETFESPGVVTGDLNGQHRWTASPVNQALVQTGTVHNGSQSIHLAAGSEPARIDHIVGSIGESVVWIDYYARIDLDAITPYRDHPDIAEAPDYAVSVFAMNADGDIYAYDGATESWVLATRSGGITGNTYHRYTVKQNYENQTWDLYVDSVLLESGLGFQDDSVVEFTQFTMIGTKGGNCYCDDISIGTAKPLGIP